MSKIPKQYRVTFKAQNKGDVPLGFAQIYEPHLKTWAKKQETQDKWAYGTYGFPQDTYFYDEEGKVWTRRVSYPNYSLQEAVWTDTIVPDELQPQIIDNTPLGGFRIQKSVSRYSTSNKLWRVFDPRGFELEITTANLDNLISECILDHGLIVATCVWEGKSLVKI